VYRFDYEQMKAVVFDPINCMVGCTTCANTCPANAISFPPLQDVLDLERRVGVHHAIEDDLTTRREQLQVPDLLPHPDRVVELEVTSIIDATPTTRLVTLAPHRSEDCLCQFIPGQYLEVQVPGTAWLARAYSLGNAPRPDGSVELQIRRVQDGRLSNWVFESARVGDVMTGRGPSGSFTMRSAPDRPLVFVAGGTGFAPIKALIEQQLDGFPDRRMLLFWGVTDALDFYELDVISEWLEHAANFDCVLAATRWPSTSGVPERATSFIGYVADAIEAHGIALSGYDAYVAGPRESITTSATALRRRGVTDDRIVADSFGLTSPTGSSVVNEIQEEQR
jgi:CDP-4-dehydro-6-deoxyglucose reductase